VPIEPMAIAHRGGAALAPENTLQAFRLAASLGFRYLETDVRATRDGRLVCFHDPTVDRVTGAHGRLNRYRANVLGRLLVNGVEPIPTLAEALDELPDCNFTLDIKEAAVVGPLAELLRSRRDVGRVCVAAAWDGWLDRLRALVPGVQTALGWRSLTAFVCRSRAGTRPPRRFVWHRSLTSPIGSGRSRSSSTDSWPMPTTPAYGSWSGRWTNRRRCTGSSMSASTGSSRTGPTCCARCSWRATAGCGEWCRGRFSCAAFVVK
jgi:Glycerophosphoryl diester phosphodiesterase family